MVLIDGNDALNRNTAAQMAGANGPCGTAACYTAGQAASCGNGTLTRTRQVIGLLAGASNYDIGHIALGLVDIRDVSTVSQRLPAGTACK